MSPRSPRHDPLVDLLDDARADHAAAERARERSLREQAAEGATLAGTLLDLAEHGAPVTLQTAAGRTHRARVGAVGADFVLLRPETGDEVLVRLGAITTVRTQPGTSMGPASGDRDPDGARLLDVLAAVAPDRPRVTVVTMGSADPVRGALRSVGLDVATLRLEGDGALCAIRASAITEVSIARSR